MKTKPFAEAEARMSPASRARSDALTRELFARAILSDLRKVAQMSQTALAEAMGITQPQVSQMEGADDMQISSLQRMVHALGGSLEIRVTLPDKGAFLISQFTSTPTSADLHVNKGKVVHETTGRAGSLQGRGKKIRSAR